MRRKRLGVGGDGGFDQDNLSPVRNIFIYFT
jgi:hypothetical protein